MAYPVPALYDDESLRSYREWLPANTWEARIQLGGSFYSPNLSDYYVTPYELGYQRIVKFDHDFIGREALEAMNQEEQRRRMTLVWNHEDVMRVLGSQFGDASRYKAIEFPVVNYAWNHFDAVTGARGEAAGVSCHAGHLSYEGEILSLALIRPEDAEPGTEVVITWGEPNGGSNKPQVEQHEVTQIRATVAPAPYSAQVRSLQRVAVAGR
jgi:glycine cleavage system aminomethyltransferase T